MFEEKEENESVETVVDDKVDKDELETEDDNSNISDEDSDEEQDDRIDEGLSPLENLDRKELYSLVDQQLKNLSKQKQEILKLRFFSGLSYEEISQKTKLNIKNVGFHISNSLSIIRKKFHQTVDKQAK